MTTKLGQSSSNMLADTAPDASNRLGFRTRQCRDLELTTAEHAYQRRGRYTVAAKVIDIFGNDTMTLVPAIVG